MAENIIDEILELQRQGRDDAEIITYLTKKGVAPAQIAEALNQAKIKSDIYGKKEGGDITGLTPSILSEKEEKEEVEAPSPGAEEEMPQEQPQYYAAQQPEYAPQGYEQQRQGIDTETIEEIAEEIVNEKWEDIKEKIEDMLEWKDFTDKRLKDFEDRAKRVESALDGMQITLVGKVQEYSQDIKNLGKEVQSLEGAFSKILSPLTSNVKDIERAAEKIKTAKAKK